MPVTAAFILPHPPLAVANVGRGKENEIRLTLESYRKAAISIKELSPDTIIVISPHAPAYSDYFHISPGKSAAGDFSDYGAGDIKISINYDEELVAEIESAAKDNGIFAGTLGAEKSGSLDHGVMVPLWFVNQAYSNYKLVRVSLSGFSSKEHYRFGVCISDTVKKTGRNAVVIASGDLSHKINAPGQQGVKSREFDCKIAQTMKSASFADFLMLDESERSSAAECGIGAFVIMAGILDKTSVRADFWSYEAPFGVGYASCAFYTEGKDQARDFLAEYYSRQAEKLDKIKSNEDAYVKLARLTVESYVKTGKQLSDIRDLADKIEHKKAGVFVSIKKHGALRGCIGTFLPFCENIADEIVQNAISACSRDNRFEPVSPDELPDLIYSVDVLSAPEQVPREKLVEMLNPSVFGVIVTSGQKRGLLLPSLDGIDLIADQLAIALKKAGIKYSEGFDVERFTVERHN